MTSAMQLALVLLGALCIAAAAVEPKFLADTLVSSKFGTKAPTKAKTSSYYGYGDTEIACLNQMNFKNCRYTGCATARQCDRKRGEDDEDGEESGTNGRDRRRKRCGPTNSFVQTDFSCCAKEHKYGYEGHDNIGVLGFSDKVGTCDWEISFYRWFDDDRRRRDRDECEEEEYTPITTDDGTALKLGTAWGTCYLNSEADNCEDPLCERMAISIQGGLYMSRAYGTSEDETMLAQAEETCAWDDPVIGNGESRRAALNTTKTTTGSKRLRGGRDWDNAFMDFIDYAFGEYWRDLGCQRPRRTTNSNTTDTTTAAAAASEGSSVDAKLAYSTEHTKLYEGCALIISGPFYETSKHNNKIEETGLFEFTPYFTGGTEVSEPTANIPIVTGKAAKIRFTREREGYYGGEEGHHEK